MSPLPTPISLRLPDETLDDIEALCLVVGMTRTDLLRVTLEDGMRRILLDQILVAPVAGKAAHLEPGQHGLRSVVRLKARYLVDLPADEPPTTHHQIEPPAEPTVNPHPTLGPVCPECQTRGTGTPCPGCGVDS